MRSLIKILVRSGRGAAVAAAIIAVSGTVETSGRPLLTAIGEITLNLGAALSEAEKMRQKVAGALQLAWIQSGAFRAACERVFGPTSGALRA
jgi:hypothetical protein